MIKQSDLYLCLMSQENNIAEARTTEERIKEAAARVFVRKGFAATKTRDIAEEAGINIASLHYYYRSKEKLFQIVIGEAMRGFSKVMDEIFNSDLPLEVKIRTFVNKYTDFFRKNPLIPIFIMSESQTNPEKLEKMLSDQKTMDKLQRQLEELADKGVIRRMHMAHFMMNLVGMTVFPFVSRPVMLRKLELSPQQYNELLEERKEMIPEIIINYMYLKKPD